MSWIERINRWFRLVLDKRRYYVAMRVEDAPDSLKEDVVYLIGDSPAPWAASLICPCGCGETISLSLIPHDKPSWRARVLKDGSATVSPSIWRTKGCRSHFFIRNGRVLWAKEDVRDTSRRR